jgi:hypothetical protein
VARFGARIERLEREFAEVLNCTGAVWRKVVLAAGERYAPDPGRDTCPRCGKLGCGVLVIAKRVVTANPEPVEART